MSRPALLLTALFLALPARGQSYTAAAEPFAPDRVLVRLYDVPPTDALTLGAATVFGEEADRLGLGGMRPLFPAPASAAAHVADARRAHGLDRVVVVEVAPGASIPAVVASLNAHPAVEVAEPDARGEAAGRPLTPGADAPMLPLAMMPNDLLFARQWSLHNTGTNLAIPLTAGADVSAPEAWDVTTGSPSVLVAVLDSGFRFSHPELAGRLWTNTAETPGNGVDDDGNGYVDDVDGWDFVNSDAAPADDNGHGANVTGIIAATGNNALGYAGLDWQARVMVLKIFDANLAGFYSWWSAAMVYAADHGARVINLSGGGTTHSTILEDAASYARAQGAVLTISMMNTNNAVVHYPAAYASTIAVGATNGTDRRAAPFCWGGGSTYGPHIDLSAPGDYIYGLTYNSDTNYGTYWCGTSMAAPHVAGAASLLLALDPTLTPEAVRTALRASADDGVGDPAEDTPGFDVYHGDGRLNVAALLSGFVDTADRPTRAPAALSAPQPNPAVSTARVAYHVPDAGTVRLAVYDVLGREVALVADGEQTAGAHAARLDVSRLATGVYVLRLTSPDGAQHAQPLTVVR